MNRRYSHLWVITAGLAPTAAHAHAFGTPYVLPIPLWMYIYGCAATLITTFAVLILRSDTPRDAVVGTSPSIARAIEFAVPPALLAVLRLGAVTALVTVILMGFLGTQDAGDNLGPTLFWVVFLLGTMYLTVVAGDVFALMNPWRQAAHGLERAGFRLFRRTAYPDRWSYWPAVILYIALAWLDLFGGLSPRQLSGVLLGYSVLTLLGGAAFGFGWLEKVEVFGVLFRTVSVISPVAYRLSKTGAYRAVLRMPFRSSTAPRSSEFPLAVFIVVVLASTTYDGIRDTQFWTALYWRNILTLLGSLWGDDLAQAQTALMSGYLVYRQAGLVILPLIYLAVYLTAVACTKKLAASRRPLRSLAMEFAYCLVPVAVAYHFAHYLPFFWVQMCALPARTAALWGASLTNPMARALNMNAVWHMQVGFLLVGHIVSVCFADTTAHRLFRSERVAVLSQMPLVTLMIGYTAIGLLILALPLGS